MLCRRRRRKNSCIRPDYRNTNPFIDWNVACKFHLCYWRRRQLVRHIMWKMCWTVLDCRNTHWIDWLFMNRKEQNASMWRHPFNFNLDVYKTAIVREQWETHTHITHPTLPHTSFFYSHNINWIRRNTWYAWNPLFCLLSGLSTSMHARLNDSFLPNDKLSMDYVVIRIT